MDSIGMKERSKVNRVNTDARVKTVVNLILHELEAMKNEGEDKDTG